MLYHGDLFIVLPTLASDSIDACVTDPPYELGFMGKSWDASGVANDVKTWQAIYRVLKPGAYLVAFGGTRTAHRMICAVEDAGFEIRDVLMWLYGQGFPKSLNIGKAMDKAATDDAKQWEGFGTALKPGYEPVVLARKPFVGTLHTNIQRYGTGALNIDACRIDAPEGIKTVGIDDNKHVDSQSLGTNWSGEVDETTRYGRWPANIVLDEEAAALLDEQSGITSSQATVSESNQHTDSGGASRFFYVAKPSREERDQGCYDLPLRTVGELTDRKDGAAGTNHARAGAGHGGGRNFHPTVKPIALMNWLVKLVTPPGGIVLDPFTGSGTTGMAARFAECQFVGCEKEADYVEIARRRISEANALLYGDEDVTVVTGKLAAAASAAPTAPDAPRTKPLEWWEE